jgi:ADP-ribosylglycohydrolase
MAGALSGAYLGRSAIPSHLVERLENGKQGRKYIEDLTSRLLNSQLLADG